MKTYNPNPIASLSSIQLRKLVPLMEERERLTVELTSILTGRSRGAKVNRGQASEAIRNLLEEAHRDGQNLSVDSIAESLDKKRETVKMWFYQNRHLKWFRRVDVGVYGYVADRHDPKNSRK